MELSHILEAAMLIIFGASWPAQILKTVRVKNPAGKSFVFLYMIMAGYLCGVTAKFLDGTWRTNWATWIYILDLILVGTDTVLSHYYLAQVRKNEGKK